MTTREIVYNANPTAVKFHNSDKFIRCFRGPVGNGKSVACIKELERLAHAQAPNAYGIRKSRAAIIRATYQQLKDTTLNTFKQWFPPPLATVKGTPPEAWVCHPLGDGTSVEMHVLFLSCATQEDTDKLLSLEITFGFINEARELPFAVVKGLRERVGRYPSAIDGYMDVYDNDGKLIYDAPKERLPSGAPKTQRNPTTGEYEIIYTPVTRKALIMDTNSPDDEHWWYQLDVDGHFPSSDTPEADRESTREAFEFFNCPPPLIKEPDGTYSENPEAENIKNLPDGYGYYLDMIPGNTPDHINVMILGNYGSLFDGKLVYPSYNDHFHVAKQPITPTPGLPIALGWDFGHTPACVIGQRQANGQIRILDEVIGDDTNIKSFAIDQVLPLLNGPKYREFEIAFSYADPAGHTEGEAKGDSCIDVLNDHNLMKDVHGRTIEQPVKLIERVRTEAYYDPSNSIDRRINGVESVLTHLIRGQPGYLLSPTCTKLRKAKLGGYCYEVIRGKNGLYQEKPSKNHYSHVSDAEQYLMGGYIRAKDRVHQERPHRQRKRSVTGY